MDSDDDDDLRLIDRLSKTPDNLILKPYCDGADYFPLPDSPLLSPVEESDDVYQDEDLRLVDELIASYVSRPLEERLRDWEASSDEGKRLFAEIILPSKADDASSSAAAPSRLFRLDSPPAPSNRSQGPEALSLHPQMESDHDDEGRRLIDDLAASCESRPLEERLRDLEASSDEDKRLLAEIILQSKADSSPSAAAPSRLFRLDSPPAPSYRSQGPEAPSLRPQMESDHDDDEDRCLIAELAASYNSCPVEEFLRDWKASSIDGNRFVPKIIRHPEAASSSSFTDATSQLFHLNSLHPPQPPPPPPPPAYWTHGPKANWLLLPREVLTVIFLKLGAIEIMESAQKVCSLWHSVAMDPSLWTQIDIRNDRNHDELPNDLVLICHHALKRSRGGCVDVSIEHFGDDYLLGYIIISGCPLRRLRLIHCLEVSNEGLSNMATKLTLLETFETYYGWLSEKALVAIGRNCPHLTTLKFIKGQSGYPRKNADKEAFAIAKHMPGLQHLTLIGNKLTNTGLKAILDGCPHLESLDLRQSYNVDLRGDIAKQCVLINNLRHPLDPFDGYGSDALVEDCYEAYSGFSMGSDDSSDNTYHSLPLPAPRYWSCCPKPNWLELPHTVLTEILLKLGAIEMIESAQKVCTVWCAVCRDPSTWTCIDMRNHGRLHNMPYDLAKMCRHAIDLSNGGCVDINLEWFGDDDLLNYIVERCCQLRRLRLLCCWSISDEGMAEAAQRMPFRETFVYCSGNLEKKALTSIGINCPRLMTLRYGSRGRGQYNGDIDDRAFAIAKNMPGLRRLSLFRIMLTNKGLGAILDGCLQLKSLDLRDCYNIDLKSSDLAKKCERIKDMRWPPNATASRFNGYDYYLSFDPLDRCSDYNYLDDSSDYSDDNPVYDSESSSYNYEDFYSYRDH